jgi:mono/diheme cytochrome c family protein
MMGWSRSWPSLLAYALAAVACGRTPPSGGTTAAPPPVVTAVGPVPGPSGDATGVTSDVPGAENPYLQDRTAATEGRKLFVRFNCSGCHGGRAGGGMGPSLRDVDWLYGDRDAQVFNSIAEGRAHSRIRPAPTRGGTARRSGTRPTPTAIESRIPYEADWSAIRQGTLNALSPSGGARHTRGGRLVR